MTTTWTDVSIDLETMSTRQDAAILSIGAVAFDRQTGHLGPTHYAEIEIASAIACGHVAADTLVWWMQQGDMARQLWQGKEKFSLSTTLLNFATWFRTLGGAPCAWGNGASFDIGILESAFANGTVGLQVPWRYTSIRDMRTIVEAAQIQPTSIEFDGTPHHALDDARHQAKVIHACLRKLAMAVELMPSELARAHSGDAARAQSLFNGWAREKSDGRSAKKSATVVAAEDNEL